MPRFLSAALMWLIDPRSVFLAAAMLAALGLLGGYVEVHERADRELALRQGPPNKVALQEFTPVMHLGPADEVRVDAEADFSRSSIISHADDGGMHHALIVPLFPVSDLGKARIGAGDAGNNALNAQVARRAEGGPETSAALGYLVHPLASREAAPADPTALAERVFGSGRYGTIVEINGQVGTTDGLGMMAVGAMSAMDITLAEQHLVIRPFGGARQLYLGGRTPNYGFVTLLGGAVLLSLLGAVLALRSASRADGHAVNHLDDEDFEPQYEPRTPGGAPTGQHPKFAPIPTQEEIIEATQPRAPDTPHWAVTGTFALFRGLWIVLTVIAAVFVWAGRAFRSRQSRQEDEAL